VKQKGENKRIKKTSVKYLFDRPCLKKIPMIHGKDNDKQELNNFQTLEVSFFQIYDVKITKVLFLSENPI